MAEVTGLVLGTVALASLFSTCVELFECFELAKDYAYDYQLACTKVALLKVRLSTWGVSLGLDKPGHERPALRQRWMEEREVISRSLHGIEDIFENASLLAEKYRLTPKRSRAVRSFSSRQVIRLPSRPIESENLKRSTTAWTLLRKRTTWAIHDKQKFDDFIKDLSFFIENLEKVAERTAMSIPKKESELVKPRVAPRPNPKALPVAISDNPCAKSKKDSQAQSVQPPMNPSAHVHKEEPHFNFDQVAFNMDGDVFIGHQQTEGGTIVMGNVGKSGKRRNLYSGNQTATNQGFAVMGNVSEEATSSLREPNRRQKRMVTSSESESDTVSGSEEEETANDNLQKVKPVQRRLSQSSG